MKYLGNYRVDVFSHMGLCIDLETSAYFVCAIFMNFLKKN